MSELITPNAQTHARIEPKSTEQLTDSRLAILVPWTEAQLNTAITIVPVAGDASFRRYFRCHAQSLKQPVILMDAPPEKEDSQPFLDCQQRFMAQGVAVPNILAHDLGIGGLLLEDLGDVSLLSQLDTKNSTGATNLYGKSLDALIALQRHVPTDGLPVYDAERLQTEMDLFTDWYLGKHLSLSLNDAQRADLQRVYSQLIDSALAQPTVCVHRDYHSRNLMIDVQGDIRIIDFQDAVAGPLTYDAVSLLRDCYISWDDALVKQWLQTYYQTLIDAQLIDSQQADWNTFIRWFDWMGVQRHLKAAGIFARLNHRDGKSGYLDDIPRTLSYIQRICMQYKELKPLGELVQQLPA